MTTRNSVEISYDKGHQAFSIGFYEKGEATGGTYRYTETDLIQYILQQVVPFLKGVGEENKFKIELNEFLESKGYSLTVDELEAVDLFIKNNLASIEKKIEEINS